MQGSVSIYHTFARDTSNFFQAVNVLRIDPEQLVFTFKQCEEAMRITRFHSFSISKGKVQAFRELVKGSRVILKKVIVKQIFWTRETKLLQNE